MPYFAGVALQHDLPCPACPVEIRLQCPTSRASRCNRTPELAAGPGGWPDETESYTRAGEADLGEGGSTTRHFRATGGWPRRVWPGARWASTPRIEMPPTLSDLSHELPLAI